MSRLAADQALATGDLSACRENLLDAVRKAPADPALRIFLFQLSAILGDWDRANNQLGVLGEMDHERAAFATVYQAAIVAEAVRASVWQGETPPSIFGEPRDWVVELVQAVLHEAQGDKEAAQVLRSRALDAAPAVPGQINGIPFRWCADADTRLGPVLEIVVGGEYNWLAFADVAKLVFKPPQHLHDAIWATASITLTNGGEVDVLVPVRYSGSLESADAELMLSRRSDFVGLSGQHVAGLGQRLIATETDDFPLLEIRELVIDQPAGAAAPPVAAEGASDG